MATISQALASKLLEEFALPETEARDPLRPLYVAGELFDWVDAKPELYDQNLAIGGRTIFEHLQQAFSDFRCDERPLVGDLTRMMPNSAGVWKMACPGLRIYGWVPAPHRFVAVRGALASKVHGKDSESPRMRQEVLDFANIHNLTETINLGDKLALFP